MTPEDYLDEMQEAGQDSYFDPRVPAAPVSKPKRWMHKTSVGVLTALAFTLLAGRAHAIFGFGDVVFDPSSYAALGQIWSQNISNYAKLTATVTQLFKIVENGVQMYELADAMRVAITHPSSLATTAYSTANSVTASKFGETVNWSRVVNSHVSLDEISAAWNRSTRQLSGSDLGVMQNDGNNSQRLADLATIEIVDGAAQACMQNIGSYRSGNEHNALSRDILKMYRVGDSNIGQNSYMAQYQIMSAGGEHQLNEQLQTNALGICEAELKIADMKMKRDEAAARIQTSVDYDNGKVGPSYNDPSGSVDALHGILP